MYHSGGLTAVNDASNRKSSFNSCFQILKLLAFNVF